MSTNDTGRFQQLESRRGIAPRGGAHVRYLSRTGWGNAMHLPLTCEEISAERALQPGFVQKVHPLERDPGPGGQVGDGQRKPPAAHRERPVRSRPQAAST